MKTTHPSARNIETTSNNFDCIRILAAVAVLFSHHFALTGQSEPSFFGLHSAGGIAVVIFFVISGYLVTSSWYNDPHFLRFSLRRILRIWPALVAVTVLTAYGLGTWVTELPKDDYVTHRATFDYLNILRMRIHYVLPGVFEHNPYARGVNGSLWTIPLEVRCYIVLALVGLIGLLKNKNVLLVIVAGYIIFFISKSSADITGTIHHGRELSAFFLAGTALYVLQPYWEQRPRLWIGTLAILTVISWWAGWKYTAVLIGLPLIIIYFGTLSTPIIRRIGRWGDPSYGIYLIAFPIQQTVILYTWPQLGFAGTLCLSLLITTALAYASWHCIEKQALKFKPRKK